MTQAWAERQLLLDAPPAMQTDQHPISSMPGAHVTRDGVFFRVWAPSAQRVNVEFPNASHPAVSLEAEGTGYFSGLWARGRAGALYRYRLDERGPYPDPCSRFQPEGPHGPSMVVDPTSQVWSDAGWPGLRLQGQVLYEMHVGTFTSEGTFDAAAKELPHLAELGISCLEIMPVAEFPGRFNWGYDGVCFFAPYHGYGDAHAFRRFVDAAHALKLGVILDVVYNHLGPDGNYLPCFSPDYFTDRYSNEWGQAMNFDGSGNAAVREFVSENAAYWIREFHLDGLRLDATQSMPDSSNTNIIAEIVARARAAASPRNIIMIGENEPQQVELLDPPERGGRGLDALWNDDFHHAARVALTGSHDGYFHDYRGHAQELVSAVRHGFLFQGQRSQWQKKPRGSSSLRREPRTLVTYIQNHDQVANTFYGQRLHQVTSAGRLRAMTALLLLAPQTPLLFMGQEFNASAPFSYFADHRPDLAGAVWAGRKEFLRQFKHYATKRAQQSLPDPADIATFQRSKLDVAERLRHASVLDLHRHLLRLRREDPVISMQLRDNLEGAVLGERALILRWLDEQHGDRLLLVNLGEELDLRPAPEPLLAPPAEARWELTWSSDDPRYDGPGAVSPCERDGWMLPAESAVLLGATTKTSTRR
jgi:maltooligosyltrehalose trehalohydrolase